MSEIEQMQWFRLYAGIVDDEKLRLLAFERHDLALAKLARNTDRDREDVVALARGPGLDPEVLRSRYRDELRPTLGRPDREAVVRRRRRAEGRFHPSAPSGSGGDRQGHG